MVKNFLSFKLPFGFHNSKAALIICSHGGAFHVCKISFDDVSIAYQQRLISARSVKQLKISTFYKEGKI